MVSDLVTNKISGSGSCLIGKLQNSSHNCDTSCCPACSKQKRSHETHKQTDNYKNMISSLLYLTSSDQLSLDIISQAVLDSCRCVQLPLKSYRQQNYSKTL